MAEREDDGPTGDHIEAENEQTLLASGAPTDVLKSQRSTNPHFNPQTQLELM